MATDNTKVPAGIGRGHTPTSRARESSKESTRSGSTTRAESRVSTKKYEDKQRRLQDQLRQQQEKATLEALKTQRKKALSRLEAEEETIIPTYKKLRSDISSDSQVKAKNLAEYIANRGGVSAGSTLQAEIMRTADLGRDIARANLSETQAISDIERRVSDVDLAYQSDVAKARAGSATGKLEDELRLMKDVRSFETEEYNRLLQDQKLADQQISRNVEINAGDYAQAMQNYLAQGGQITDPQYIAYATARKNKLLDIEDREMERLDRESLRESREASIEASKASRAYTQARTQALEEEDRELKREKELNEEYEKTYDKIYKESQKIYSRMIKELSTRLPSIDAKTEAQIRREAFEQAQSNLGYSGYTYGSRFRDKTDEDQSSGYKQLSDDELLLNLGYQ